MSVIIIIIIIGIDVGIALENIPEYSVVVRLGKIVPKYIRKMQ